MTSIRGTTAEQAVEVEIEIEASAEAVFDFLVVPEKLLRWMGQEASLDARPDGELDILVNDDDRAVGRFLTVERPKRVSFTWGWAGSDLVPPGASTVEISLREIGSLTIVTLVHTGLPAGQDEKHLQGWLHFGGQLRQVVESEVGAG